MNLFYWPKFSHRPTVHWGCLGPSTQHWALCLVGQSVCVGPCGTHPMWPLWNRDFIFCYFLKLLNPAPKIHGPSLYAGHLAYFFNYLGFLTEQFCDIWKAFFFFLSVWSCTYFHCTAAILDLASLVVASLTDTLCNLTNCLVLQTLTSILLVLAEWKNMVRTTPKLSKAFLAM